MTVKYNFKESEKRSKENRFWETQKLLAMSFSFSWKILKQFKSTTLEK